MKSCLYKLAPDFNYSYLEIISFDVQTKTIFVNGIIRPASFFICFYELGTFDLINTPNEQHRSKRYVCMCVLTGKLFALNQRWVESNFDDITKISEETD